MAFMRTHSTMLTLVFYLLGLGARFNKFQHDLEIDFSIFSTNPTLYVYCMVLQAVLLSKNTINLFFFFSVFVTAI